MACETRFLCDSMLGGLARWLRAAGYQAGFERHIRDGDLVRRAFEEGWCLLTSDSGIMDRYAVSEGLLRCIFVPLGLDPAGQLAHVLAATGLPLGEPRCMDCGGELDEVPLGEVQAEVPLRVKGVCRRFWRCRDCAKVYWRGTHWKSISRKLEAALRQARQEGT
jgi:hypothetical protein